MDEAKVKRIGKRDGEEDQASTKPSPFAWKTLTVQELVRYMDEIRGALPPLELSALNLEEEALLQYHTLRQLQADVFSADDVPANQRAQVANAVAATLRTLGDMQIALYSSERFKDIENALIRALTKLPEETAAVFIRDYTAILKERSRMT